MSGFIVVCFTQWFALMLLNNYIALKTLFILGHRMAVSDHLFNAAKLSIAVESALAVLLGCFLAFMLSISEFLLLAQTSSLTLSISGIFKVSSGILLDCHYSSFHLYLQVIWVLLAGFDLIGS